MSCPRGLGGTNLLCCSCWQIRFLIKIIYFLRHGGNINLTEPPCEAAACLPQAQMALREPSERTRSCRIEEVWAAMLVMLTLGEEEEEEEEGKITPSVQLLLTSDTHGAPPVKPPVRPNRHSPQSFPPIASHMNSFRGQQSTAEETPPPSTDLNQLQRRPQRSRNDPR